MTNPRRALLAIFVLALGLLVAAPATATSGGRPHAVEAAKAGGFSSPRCQAHEGNGWTICSEIYARDVGTQLSMTSVRLCVDTYKVHVPGPIPNVDTAFRNTFDSHVKVIGSNGASKGSADLSEVDGEGCVVTSISINSGQQACYTVWGRADIKVFDDEDWIMKGNVLGGACAF